MELETVILRFCKNLKITLFALSVCAPFSEVKSQLQRATGIAACLKSRIGVEDKEKRERQGFKNRRQGLASRPRTKMAILRASLKSQP